ncbi:MAG: hypothetical protein K0Q77_1946 [Anaerosporomusa subterranea]|nr:hypothetical protein [Anaerosporomusa subterranea]
METGKIMASSEHNTAAQHQEINHVGGINEELGGVDPRADENLMRLSGGH